MFNIGIIELLIVIFFVVLFVKPEEIPKILKNLGLMYRKSRDIIIILSSK